MVVLTVVLKVHSKVAKKAVMSENWMAVSKVAKTVEMMAELRVEKRVVPILEGEVLYIYIRINTY